MPSYPGTPSPNRPRRGSGLARLVTADPRFGASRPRTPTSRAYSNPTNTGNVPLQGRIGNAGSVAGIIDTINAARRDVDNAGFVNQGADPYAGLTPFDAAQAILTMQNGSGGGNGGRGRGGGGVGGGNSAGSQALSDAYRSALSGIVGGTGFDQTEASLRAARDAALARQAGIMGELGANSAAVAQRTNAAYESADQALADLAAAYGQRAGGVDAGARQFAEAFGGNVGTTGGGVADLVNAARALNAQRQGAQRVADAQRGNVYGAWNSDVLQAQGGGFDALMAKLALARQADAQRVAQERQALILQAAREGVTL